MTKAPLYTDIPGVPDTDLTTWRICADGKRIRVALWQNGTKGTILIFPGRTEYIEKYGPTVSRFLDRGYSVGVVDWRGQGLSDRPEGKPFLGHVRKFSDFQQDVVEFLKAVDEAGLPPAVALVGHSMGGAIGLRALLNGLPVQKSIFSAPMWGIYMKPVMRRAAKIAAMIGPFIGLGKNFAPSTGPDSYVVAQPFEGNTQTNDPKTYQWLKDQLARHPELGLGGPSLSWLGQGMSEGTRLVQSTVPAISTLCFLGTEESIVDSDAIKTIMAKWSNGTLDIIQGAQHEILMEEPHVQTYVWDQIDKYLAS